MRNRFPDLISLNPNKLPRQLYLSSRSTCARLSAISHNLHRVHWFPVNIARYRPAHCRSRMPITVTASDHRDQCRCVTQRHVNVRSVHTRTPLQIIYLKLNKPEYRRTMSIYARARARERAHRNPHIQRAHTHAAPERKADTSAPNSPS